MSSPRNCSISSTVPISWLLYAPGWRDAAQPTIQAGAFGAAQLRRQVMKSFHAVALICFCLAFAFYLASSIPSAWGLAAVGMVFELVGWLIVFKTRKKSIDA